MKKRIRFFFGWCLHVCFLILVTIIYYIHLIQTIPIKELLLKIIEEKGAIKIPELPRIQLSIKEGLALRIEDFHLSYPSMAIDLALNQLDVYRVKKKFTIKVEIDSFKMDLPTSKESDKGQKTLLRPSQYWDQYLNYPRCFKDFCLNRIEIKAKNISVGEYQAHQFYLDLDLDLGHRLINLSFNPLELNIDSFLFQITSKIFLDAQKNYFMANLLVKDYQKQILKTQLEYDFAGNLSGEIDAILIKHPKIPKNILGHIQNKNLKGKFKVQLEKYHIKMEGVFDRLHHFNFIAQTNKNFDLLSGDLKLKDKQFLIDIDSKFKLNINKKNGKFSNKIVYYKLPKGKIILHPMELKLSPSQIMAKGKIHFHHVHYKIPQYALYFQDVHGPLLYNLSLRIDTILNKWEYTNLSAINPFEKVDYLKMRPYFQNNNQTVTIKKFNINNNGYQLGPIHFDFDLNENIYSLKNFSMELDDGRFSGHIIIQYQPYNSQIGLYGHMSSLNPAYLLPPEYKSLENVLLNGRVHLLYAIEKNSLEGRIDIYKISRHELLKVLALLDPNYENEKFIKLRSLLGLAEPRYIGVEFINGGLNMEVHIQALGTTNTFSLKGLPITKILFEIQKNIANKKKNLPIK